MYIVNYKFSILVFVLTFIKKAYDIYYEKHDTQLRISTFLLRLEKHCRGYKVIHFHNHEKNILKCFI